MTAALDQGVGYGIVLGLGAAFALGESRRRPPPSAAERD